MPRSAASILAELDATDAAILRALDAAAVGSNGNTLQNQRLTDLRSARAELQREYDAVTGAAQRFQPVYLTGLGTPGPRTTETCE